MAKLKKQPDFVDALKLKGQDTVSTLSEYDGSVTNWLPTGLTPLDAILGGGFPYGRVGEIYGGESYGKTTIAVGALKSAIDAGGIGVLIDTERSFDKNRAKLLGIDPDKVTTVTPASIPEVFDAVARIAEATSTGYEDVPISIVWDSLSQTCSPRELSDREEYGVQVGAHARAMSEAMRRLSNNNTIIGTNIVFIVINQVRDKIDGGAFNKFTPHADVPTFGGRALKFASSFRLYIRTSSKYKGESRGIDRSEGAVSHVRLVKSKVSTPDKEIRVPFLYRHGIDDVLACWFYLQDADILEKNKAWYKWEDGKKYQEYMFVEKCRNDPEFFARVQQVVMEHGSKDWTVNY